MCQQPSVLPTTSSGPPHSGTSLKVPFGVREGKVLRPEQVQPGLACRCLCPGCGTSLVAKARNSQHRRPYFAHMADAECRAGYETALHLKAKELIAQHARLWLPSWDGEEGMANPPALSDDEGEIVAGDRIHFPSREAALSDIRLEVRCGDYVPDIIANDGAGELLIEIRVSHAVDEVKRRRIQSEGRRLVEIDLSRLDQNVVADEDQLRHAVLEDPKLRVWLSCPEATDAWRESLRALKVALDRRNKDLALKRAELQAAENARQIADDRAIAEEEAGRANRDGSRDQAWAPHWSALSALPELISLERIELLLQEYAARDRAEIARLVAEIPDAAVRNEVQLIGPNGWLYTVHPAYWQSALYCHFALGRSPGHQFNSRDAARWVMTKFGKEEPLYTLFRTQYALRRRSASVSANKRKATFRAFTDMENQPIPNFYGPVNNFLDRLVHLGVIGRARSAGAGTYSVCRSNQSGGENGVRFT